LSHDFVDLAGLCITALIEGAQGVGEIVIQVKAGELADFVLNGWIDALKRADDLGSITPLEDHEKAIFHLLLAAKSSLSHTSQLPGWRGGVQRAPGL